MTIATADAGSACLLEVGARLRVAHWRSGSGGRGTVILVHGRGEFIEVYAETVQDLRARGYAVLTYDHRGQGGSERTIAWGGHVGSFREYADDLVDVVRYAAQAGLPRPYFILAHSMGGLVALLAAPRIADEVERMVLLAPMLAIARLPASAAVLSLVTTGLSLVGQARRPLQRRREGSTPFARNRLTTDPVRYRTLCALADTEPALMVGPPTVGWLRAALRAMGRVAREEGDLLPVPTLFVASGHDAIVSTPAIDRFARNALGGGSVIIPDARHHVLLEHDRLRDLALTAMDAFLADAPQRLTDTRMPGFARPLRVRPIAPIGLGGESLAEAEAPARRRWLRRSTKPATERVGPSSDPAAVPERSRGPLGLGDGSRRLRRRLKRRRDPQDGETVVALPDGHPPKGQGPEGDHPTNPAGTTHVERGPNQPSPGSGEPARSRGLGRITGLRRTVDPEGGRGVSGARSPSRRPGGGRGRKLGRP